MVDRPNLNLYGRDVKMSKLYSLFSLPIQPSVSPDSSPIGMSDRRYHAARKDDCIRRLQLVGQEKVVVVEYPLRILPSVWHY